MQGVRDEVVGCSKYDFFRAVFFFKGNEEIDSVIIQLKVDRASFSF